jgi:DNA-binding NarL/FixJ family response regulator
VDELIRVALCDDHSVVRAGLRAVLAIEAGIEVAAEAANVEEAERVAVEHQPDVFVMDLNLPDGSGLDATRRVLAASPATKVLVLTVHDDVAYLRRAFEAGASGYLVKEAADFELVLAVREVAAGRHYVHPRLGAELLISAGTEPNRPSGPGGQLSERELDVLRLIARGYTNGQAADELHVSIRTVETHRAHIQQKLGVRSRAELVQAAKDAHLFDGRPDQ